MNEQLDDIGKRLPYTESEEYLNNLIDTMTENAILQQPRAKKNRHWGMMMAASAAAVVLLILGIGLSVIHQSSKTEAITLQTEGPIDEFLSSLSDEEAAQLPYYEIDEIPEY